MQRSPASVLRLGGLLGRPHPRRPSPAGLVVAVAGLLVATPLVALLEGRFNVPDASIVYLLPVVVAGSAYGTWLAIGAACASFLLYDFLFTEPRYTFAVARPEDWLNLLLFLVVAIAIGRLGALQLQRRREAELRTAEARALFVMTRDLAAASTALEAAPLLATRLARDAEMTRVWIALGAAIPDERIVGDSQPTAPRPPLTTRWVLHPGSADADPSWVRVHDPGPSRGREHARDGEVDDSSLVVFRAPITAGTASLGSLWALRPRSAPFPGRSHSRLLAASASQFGQTVTRDRLAAEATAAEVARQGDTLKSALLDSVSHDLRTPIAGIRAAAGNLMDPDVEWDAAAARESARAIDAEAERLGRLVGNMLDLSKIQGNALEPSLELYDLADLVERAVERLGILFGSRPPEVTVPESLPPVRADALFVDQIVTNLLENAARYAAGGRVRVSARGVDPGCVELVVEDDGPGVPPSALPRLFDRFYRAPLRRGASADGGSGVGLAVVRGMAESMGGTVEARQSPLGGLAVAVRLPAESIDVPVDGARQAPGEAPE